jgi:hypothetical protein
VVDELAHAGTSELAAAAGDNYSTHPLVPLSYGTSIASMEMSRPRGSFTIGDDLVMLRWWSPVVRQSVLVIGCAVTFRLLPPNRSSEAVRPHQGEQSLPNPATKCLGRWLWSADTGDRSVVLLTEVVTMPLVKAKLIEGVFNER